MFSATGDSLEAELRKMRMALGYTPISRIQNLENDFIAVEEAARATEVAYEDVIARLRQNDLEMQNSLYQTSGISTPTDELRGELHQAAAKRLQSGARPKGNSDIDSSNILAQRLRGRKRVESA